MEKSASQVQSSSSYDFCGTFQVFILERRMNNNLNCLFFTQKYCMDSYESHSVIFMIVCVSYNPFTFNTWHCFLSQRKVVWVWINIRVSKWQQYFYFGLNCCFKWVNMNLALQSWAELPQPDSWWGITERAVNLPHGFISARWPLTQPFIHYSECIHVQIMKLRRVAISSLFAQNNLSAPITISYCTIIRD